MYKQDTKGNEVTKYKGVCIFITPSGEFFCDCIKNSNVFEDKTFNSNKLQSIVKAIDNFKGNEISDIFYKLDYYPVRIQKIKATSKVGDRILFSDGTDSESVNRRNLHKEKISKTKEFKKLLELELEDEKIFKEKKILEDKLRKIRNQAKHLITKIN